MRKNEKASSRESIVSTLVCREALLPSSDLPIQYKEKVGPTKGYF